jgi:sulfatase maturation enzyme AslB (radical SAM superfamily)
MLNPSEPEWIYTSDGKKRGWIKPQKLKEFWIHSGTVCNLRCPFCFEGSKPRNQRLDPMSLNDAKGLIDEAIDIGIEHISFTGGEPFLNKDFIEILNYTLDWFPALVLTNGTTPLLKHIEELKPLYSKKHPLSLRISIDYSDEKQHDAGRGAGNFARSLESMKLLSVAGFKVIAARISHEGENATIIEQNYRGLFRKKGIPETTGIVSFPSLALPGEHPNCPEITEDCIRNYCNADKVASFMCSYSKMAVKKDGRIAILPCTLVDDDEMFYLYHGLKDAMKYKVMLKHPRCFSCFSQGVRCDA